MIFWIAAAVLSALAVGGLLMPLLTRPHAGAARADYDVTVYKDQLAEIDRDEARGEIGADQAAAARTEVERRLLAVAKAAAGPQRRRDASGAGQTAMAIALAIAVPVLAVGTYLWLGAPGIPSQPFAERRTALDADAPAGPALSQLAEGLAARLAAEPNDLEAWQLLARTYAQLGRFADVARAYAQAIGHGFDGADMHSAHGEALTAAANGTVTPAARQAFAAALERNPAEPRARYYAGLALAQDGRVREAMTLWTELLRETPPEAPWRAFIAGQVRQAAAALGAAPPPEAAEAPPATGSRGPSQADVEAAGQMSTEERAAFIRSMVERLANRLEEAPNDLNGWLRLAQAYGVLGEPARARAALTRAEMLAADLPAEAPEHATIEALRQSLPVTD